MAITPFIGHVSHPIEITSYNWFLWPFHCGEKPMVSRRKTPQSPGALDPGVQAVRQRQGLHREAVDACRGHLAGYGVVVNLSVNQWEIMWETHEIDVVFIWCLYGVYIVCFFCLFLLLLWCLYGVSMLYIYIYIYGVYMAFIWSLHGVYMVFIWFISGLYVYIYIMTYKCVIIPCIKLYNGESNGTHGFHGLMNDIMGI